MNCSNVGWRCYLKAYTYTVTSKNWIFSATITISISLPNVPSLGCYNHHNLIKFEYVWQKQRVSHWETQCKAPTLHMKSINFMTEMTTYNFVFKCLSLVWRNHNSLAMSFGTNRHLLNLTLFCFFPHCRMNASYSYYYQSPSHPCVTNWMVVPSTGLQTEAPSTTSVLFSQSTPLPKKWNMTEKKGISIT